jgi:2'-5' RNA ligase
MSEAGRLFVAGVLPPVVAGELARWGRGVRAAALRRLDPGAMHLTLCFLGEQSLLSVEPLGEVLGGAAEALAGVGELRVGAPVWLPPRNPRALAVEIGDPEGGLRALQRLLAREIAATIDWAPDRQRFRPHVTVARIRAGERVGALLAPTPGLSFALERVALFRSWLEPAGARYEELASVGGW